MYLLERRPREALPLLKDARSQVEQVHGGKKGIHESNAFWTYYLLGLAHMAVYVRIACNRRRAPPQARDQDL